MKTPKGFIPLLILLLLTGVLVSGSIVVTKVEAAFPWWDNIVQFFHNHFGIPNPPGTTGGGTTGVGSSGNAIIQSQPTSFGVQMQSFNILPISELQSTGLTSAIAWLWIYRYTNQDGSLNIPKIQYFISRLEAANGNQTLYLHLMSGPETLVKTPPDLSVFSSQVSQIVTALKGKVKGYAIENEVTGWTWSGTPQQYTDTLAAGYKAIKAADPQALVFDSGTPEVSYGVTIANAFVQQGKTQAAIDFVNIYYKGIHSGVLNLPLPIQTAAQLNQLLNGPGTQESIQIENDLFTKDAPYIDVIQTHFYCMWDGFPAVFDYINQSLLAHHLSKPVQVWELGEQFHGTSVDERIMTVSKDIAIAAGHGASLINWYSYLTNGGAAGLASSDGTPTPAWPIFQQTVEALNEATNPQILSEDTKKNGIWAYEYIVGGKPLWIAWSSKPTHHALPGVTGSVTVQTAGNSTTITVNASSIPLDTTPVFIKQ